MFKKGNLITPDLHIIQGDITRAEVDAIVNAANSSLLGGGGVDGAIHRAAGPGLLDACKKIKATADGIRCPVGEARITPGFNLPAKYVIHTVGPRYGIDKAPEKLLRSAYRNSLELALANNCKSIAFPAISCGAYGYPMKEAAEIAISTCMDPKYEGLQIYFYLFTKDAFDLWMDVLTDLRRN